MARDDEQGAPLPGAELPRPMPLAERVVLALCALFVAGVLVVLALVEPDARGLGTHEALGLAPCGFLLTHGYPCPTCGVTTAGALLLHLRPLAALETQPFGALLCVAGTAFLWLALRHLWRGESLVARVAFWPWVWILVTFLVVLFASWGYKALAGLAGA